MMKKTLGIVVITLIIGMAMSTALLGETLSREVPSELARWRAWVLHDHEEALCPGQYNDGAVVRCQWPSYLQIDVSDNAGRFEQHWQVFAPGWVTLPGGTALWPQDVVADGRPVAVIGRNQTPSVYLAPGIYNIKGHFSWSHPPETIQVPPALGLLALTVAGQTVDAPVIDTEGRLWLQEHEQTAGREDRVTVRIFRLINDVIPMQVTTLVRLDVSGRAREIDLDGLLLSGAIPMQLDSRLPARLDKQGRLLVQARPGRWEVRLRARMPESVRKISVTHIPYGDEVWSFQPQNHLRMVTLSGAPRIEPGQTEMPGAWRRYSAYLIAAPTSLAFKETRRGDPDPAPDQLTLDRRWWLDFDGHGLTMHDQIIGTLSRQWSLAVNAPMALGRVALDGKDQVITLQGEHQKAGVELRRGMLNLQADSRMPVRTVRMAVVGWDHDFKKVTGRLHLPPGWRLLAAPGVDEVSDTWFQRWSLFDFFLVLIIALAVYKLRNWLWGLLALGAMALIFHEPGAPRFVWLHLLAALALLPLLPAGRLKQLVSLWGIAAGVVLLIITIPFVANQIRWGIYPQLAPHQNYTRSTDRAPSGIEPAKKAAMEVSQEAPVPSGRGKTRPRVLQSTMNRLSEADALKPATAQPPPAIWQHDPDALIPTGPGLPDWQWRTISLDWSGPLARDQEMQLYLLSPVVNLALSLLRVGLLVLLIWGFADWRAWWQKIRQQIDAKALTAAVVLPAMVGLSGVDARAEQGAFPPAELLETFRQRLLAPEDCQPHCADISRLEIAISDEIMQMMLNIHAADPTMVPLPVNRKSWTPSQILIDNVPITALARDASGTLWAVVPPGSHTVILRGSVAREGMVSIPLPLKPRQAGFVAKGWTVKGILADGRVGSSIQLNRLPAKDQDAAIVRGNGGALEPFLAVERILHLGMSWRLHTTVRRLTPPGKPVVVSVPLLADESVTTAGLLVEQGAVVVNMSAEQRQLSFSSNLKVDSKIELTAPRAVPWTETWILDASPIWHCDLAGIAPIHHQDGAGQWQPRWQPWPGESVTIGVERPRAMEGQLVTIRRTQLKLTPGQRFGIGELVMEISTSRGGQHTLALPEQANLQKVQVNGKSLPIRQDGQWVTVPLKPGTQSVSVMWHQLSAFGMLFKAPAIKMGAQAVNAKVTIQLPDRWILLVGGPDWGPAVLFWSYLAVVVIAALGLGRLTLTPLKGWQWLLLGLGMTQIPVVMALLIVGWLVVLGIRARQPMPGHWLGYNSLQLGIMLWSVVALIALFAAVKAGLISRPDMQIAGNQSTDWMLHWTQDRMNDSMPRPWVLSLPIWVYRALMLAWSLWLAMALLGWLKWGWQCFVKDGVWKERPRKVQKAAALPK